MSETSYFNPEDLKKFGNIVDFQKEYGQKFFQYYSGVFKEGALTEREKALIGLAISHAFSCPYCIEAYSKSCLEKGADEEQMMEAVHVAAALKAGITLVNSTQMMNHVQRLMM
jgi:alkylhydroperoxidase/carboxymuconolactone decarboxylase family protein